MQLPVQLVWGGIKKWKDLLKRQTKQNLLCWGRVWLGNWLKAVLWSTLSSTQKLCALDWCSLTTHTLTEVNTLLSAWLAHKFVSPLISKGCASALQMSPWNQAQIRPFGCCCLPVFVYLLHFVLLREPHWGIRTSHQLSMVCGLESQMYMTTPSIRE